MRRQTIESILSEPPPGLPPTKPWVRLFRNSRLEWFSAHPRATPKAKALKPAAVRVYSVFLLKFSNPVIPCKFGSSVELVLTAPIKPPRVSPSNAPPPRTNARTPILNDYGINPRARNCFLGMSGHRLPSDGIVPDNHRIADDGVISVKDHLSRIRFARAEYLLCSRRISREGSLSVATGKQSD